MFGLKGESLGNFTIELSDEIGARSCGGGFLKKARLMQNSVQSVAKEAETKGYFPTYWAHGERLMIELDQPGVCDGGLVVEGKFAPREGKGDYFSVSRGNFRHPLGTFTAVKR